MPDSIHRLPLLVSGPLIVLLLCAFGVVGLEIARRLILPRLRVSTEDSEFTGTMVQSIMVFYGLALALIAVSVWQSYSEVSKIVSGEAAHVAALYRDLRGYPEPIRGRLQQELRSYVEYVIDTAWPEQSRGRVPQGGVERMNRFQDLLIGFEPATEGQRLLHAETLRAYNAMVHARRLRLDAVQARLPDILWMVVFAGSLISLGTSFFFKVEDARLHRCLVCLLATFMGLVIFMTLALDRPFLGDLAIGSEPYQLVRDHLMSR